MSIVIKRIKLGVLLCQQDLLVQVLDERPVHLVQVRQHFHCSVSSVGAHSVQSLESATIQ